MLFSDVDDVFKSNDTGSWNEDYNMFVIIWVIYFICSFILSLLLLNLLISIVSESFGKVSNQNYNFERALILYESDFM